MYLLTERKAQTGKYLARGHGMSDRVQQGPRATTECQIFFRPALPISVNKLFIIWPPRFSFIYLFFGNKICYRDVHLRRSFWPKSQDLYSNKVFSFASAKELYVILGVPEG